MNRRMDLYSQPILATSKPVSYEQLRRRRNDKTLFVLLFNFKKNYYLLIGNNQRFKFDIT